MQVEPIELRRRLAGFLLFSALVTAVVYWGGLRNEFVFDDYRFIDGTLPLDKTYTLSFGFRGLWAASFPFIHQLVGPDIAWQRGVNLAFHIMNGWLLWYLGVRLIARALWLEHRGKGGDTVLAAPDGQWFLTENRKWSAALSVAVLWWVLNPVAVYAVGYLIQRSTLMATFFSLVMLLSFLQGLESRRIYWYGLSVVAYAMALWSKEHAAPIAAVLLPLYIFWARPSKEVLLRIGTILAGGVVIAAVAMIRLKGWELGGATEDMINLYLEELRRLEPQAEKRVYALSVINQMGLFFRYGLIWVIPWVGWMSIDIRVPFPIELWSIYLVGPIAYVALMMVSAYLVIRKSGRMGLVGLLLLIPGVLFTTELAYVRLQEAFVLYRSYLWSVSWPILVALVLGTVFSERRWIYGLGVLIASVLAIMSHERIKSFQNNVAVWRDAVEKLESSASANVFGRWRAPLNLSMGLLGQKNYQDAIKYAQMSEMFNCPNGLATFNAAAAWSSLNVLDVALESYNQAEQKGFPRLDVLYRDRAGLYVRVGRIGDAVLEFDRAIERASNDESKLATLVAAGRAFNSVQEYDKAIRYYMELAQLRPDSTAAALGIAFAYYKKGDVDAAFASLNQSLAKRPTPEILHARSYLFHQLGNRQRALADITAALAMMPGHPPYLQLRQQILSGQKIEGEVVVR